MDRRIKLLEDSLINKIAAGEVVERPSSIVKELVENSIDAGAKNISIEIKNGGIGFIKIQDDGSGIRKEDIKTAFLRHATSKLEKIDDLENMLTLGFRGEALASICSISMLEMTTMTEDDTLASKISIEGGKIISEEEVAGVKGTTFVIKNVFYNTPARRQFLKKDSIEAGYIFEIITRLALANKDIAFKYTNNNSLILSTSGNGSLKDVIFSIYGKEITKNLIEIEEKEKEFLLKGYIALPNVSKSNRSFGNIFINGRYVKNKLISKAIEDAYAGRLMVGKFPIYILNLIPVPNTVDVNVHPTKLEVRFSDEDFIYNFVYRAVKEALENEVIIPNIEAKKEKVLFENKEKISFKEKELNNIPPSNFYKANKTIPFNIDKQKALEDILLEQITPKIEKEDISLEEIKPIKNMLLVCEEEQNISIGQQEKEIIEEKQDKKINKTNFFNNYKIIGQIFNTYWIVEQDKEIYLIDQHSAHERVIYEKLLKSFKEEKIASQTLLKPIIVNVAPLEDAIIKENISLISNFGFDIEEFGEDSYAIRGVPVIFKTPLSPSFINEIIDILSDKNLDNIYDMKIEKIISMSCKKAVKGNDKLDFAEAKALIEDMLKLDNPFSCPHGRPTVVKFSKSEIEKMFNRT